MVKTMKDQYKFIFDMDGTLYQFDKGRGNSFASSEFYSDIKTNIYAMLMEIRGISRDEAQLELERIKDTYDEGLSIGFEREFGIDRYDYFARTWNLDPEKYIDKDNELRGELEALKGRVALLTAAPRIWAVNVLAYLNLDEIFEENIYTGEPDERKPNPIVFSRIAEQLGSSPQTVFSIGDQEYSDILPAKEIGMRTVFIGPEVTQSSADYRAPDVKLAVNLLRKEGFI